MARQRDHEQLETVEPVSRGYFMTASQHTADILLVNG